MVVEHSHEHGCSTLISALSSASAAQESTELGKGKNFGCWLIKKKLARFKIPWRYAAAQPAPLVPKFLIFNYIAKIINQWSNLTTQ